jgi:hypothetical protein
MLKESNDLLDMLECRWYWCGALPPLFIPLQKSHNPPTMNCKPKADGILKYIM